MSQQIKKKFIADKAVDGDKIELEAGQALKQDGQELIKLDAQGRVLITTGEAATKQDVLDASFAAQQNLNAFVGDVEEDKNSLEEIVAFINEVDQENDAALDGYVTSNNIRMELVEDDLQELTSYQQTFVSSTLTQVEVDQGYLDFSKDGKTLVQDSTRVFIDRLAIHPELDYKVENLGSSQYRLHFIKEMYNGVNATDIEGSAKAPSEEAPEAGDTITLYFQVYTPIFVDTDGDGVEDSMDAFPNNASESVDSDGDGVGDNADVFPNNASESVDTDGDGVGDNADPDLDNDNVPNELDAFPNDPLFSNETSGPGILREGTFDFDGIGDEAAYFIESITISELNNAEFVNIKFENGVEVQVTEAAYDSGRLYFRRSLVEGGDQALLVMQGIIGSQSNIEYKW